ncbi:MAG: hypothetical protein V5A88_09295, partial [Candidatus Thermoplasmatota archaeon]
PQDQTESSSGTYTYTYEVENAGNTEDTYALEAEAVENGWSAVPIDAEVTVGAGVTESVDVEVSIPGDAGGENSNVALEATSKNDSTLSDSDSMTVALEENYAVTVTAPDNQTETCSGPKEYSFQVENQGNIQDIYTLSVTDTADWDPASPNEVSVAPQQTEVLNVSVNIPDRGAGDSNTVTISANSQNSGASDSDSFNIDNEHDPLVIVYSSSDQNETTGGNYTYHFELENPSGFQDTYDIEVDDSKNWVDETQTPDSITVSSGATEELQVVVVIPSHAGGETSTVSLTGVSQSDSMVTDTDSMEVTLEENTGVLVTAPQDHSERSTGTYTYTYQVENTGNIEDIYDLSVNAEQSGWSASLKQSTVTISPGDVEEINADVTIPENADDGEGSEITLTAESQADPGVLESDSMIVSYTEEDIREVSVTAPSDAVEDEPGTSTYSFEVDNTGTVDDNYDLSVDSSDWETDAPNEISVNESNTETVNVQITIPEDAEYGESTEVTLTAESQEDEGVSASDSMVLTFSQEPIEYELTIDAEEGGTTDPGPGNYTYQGGTEVTVEAKPDEGWYFDGWAGDHESREKEITITMDGDKELTAHFEQVGEGERVMTIQVEGEGTTEPEPGSYTYEEGKEVTVEALPGEGWRFSNWSGDVNDTQREEVEITVVVDEDIEITAHFEEVDIGVEIVSPEDGALFGESQVLLEWEAHNADRHNLRVNEGGWIDVGEETTYQLEGLDDGSHTIELRASGWGVSANDSLNITVDTIPPELEIVSPEQGEGVTDSYILAEWEAYDNISGVDHCEVRVNGGEWIELENETSYELDELEEGEYNIALRAVDIAGNEAEDEVSFTVESEETSSFYQMIFGMWWIFLLIPFILIAFLLISRKRKRDTVEEESERDRSEFLTELQKIDEGSEGRTHPSQSGLEEGMSDGRGKEGQSSSATKTEAGEAEESDESSVWKEDAVEKKTAGGDETVEEIEGEEFDKDDETLSGGPENIEDGSEMEVMDKLTEEDSGGQSIGVAIGGDKEGEDLREVKEGEKREDETEIEEKTENRCPECGKEILPEETLCTECQQIMGDEGEDIDLEGDIFTECEECGLLITKEEDECPYCEKPIESGAGKEESEDVEDGDTSSSSSNSSLDKKCPECEAEMSSDQEVCHKCGYIFLDEE